MHKTHLEDRPDHFSANDAKGERRESCPPDPPPGRLSGLSLCCPPRGEARPDGMGAGWHGAESRESPLSGDITLEGGGAVGHRWPHSPRRCRRSVSRRRGTSLVCGAPVLGAQATRGSGGRAERHPADSAQPLPRVCSRGSSVHGRSVTSSEESCTCEGSTRTRPFAAQELCTCEGSTRTRPFAAQESCTCEGSTPTRFYGAADRQQREVPPSVVGMSREWLRRSARRGIRADRRYLKDDRPEPPAPGAGART